jgi:hypothetical protein
MHALVRPRVARWFTFRPNIPIWVFLGAFERKMLVYFMTIWSSKRPFLIFCGHLVKLVVIWLNFSRFGMFGPRKIWQPWSDLKALAPKTYFYHHQCDQTGRNAAIWANINPKRVLKTAEWRCLLSKLRKTFF